MARLVGNTAQHGKRHPRFGSSARGNVAFHVNRKRSPLTQRALFSEIGDEAAIGVADAAPCLWERPRKRRHPAGIACAGKCAGHPLADHPVANPQGWIERASHAETDDPLGTRRQAGKCLGQLLRIPAPGHNPHARAAQHRALAVQSADGDYIPQTGMSELAALRLR